MRFWRLTASYIFGLSLFDESSQADRTDHRFAFASQFILRTGLSIDITYRYRQRRFEDPVMVMIDDDRERDEFDRNEVMLSLTYGRTFRF